MKETSQAYETATVNFRKDNNIYLYSSERGSIVLPNFGQLAQHIPPAGDFIQFIVSDASDTQYVERYHNGEVSRKFISTDGEVAEDVGEGFLEADDYVLDVIWNYLEKTLGIHDMTDLPFDRYVLLEP
ncbi:MAG: hypothetical protein AAF399_18675 [Bacteroidota bacterium]